jgi:hypothetical protein
MHVMDITEGKPALNSIARLFDQWTWKCWNANHDQRNSIMNAAITGEIRALSAYELDAVSGGTFTLDLGWASLTLGMYGDKAIIAVGCVGSHCGAVTVPLPK